MHPKPQISIIIPCFNRLSLLKETVASVLVQDSNAWELILVDDGSNLATVNYIEELAKNKSQVRFLQRERAPKGAPTCRNIGAFNASSDYIVFLDSDDLILPNFVSQRIDAIQKFPEKDFIVFPTAIFNKKIDDATFLWNTLHKNKSDLTRFFDDDTPWHTSGPVWKKAAFLDIGGFNQNVFSGQDWEVHVKALINELSYVKSEENNEAINHFMRDDIHDSITSGFLNTKKLLNRYEMYSEILRLLSQKKSLLKQLQNNVIKYFYRSAAMGINLGLKEDVKAHIFQLKRVQIASNMLCKLLLTRLHNIQRPILIKLIDVILYRKYNISNIDFPVDRTKGIVNYKKRETFYAN